ncbi:MAG: sulfite exporter TauE/SafE family protein [Bacteroidetes bacterium]|nr:MAG: sulfite exporter TauE/SafE family protein [Bacteroidota bacterium]RLD93377.1 MAG: sulfite exporter TauE/SafE family protein [Bacteroidota bacterium]
MELEIFFILAICLVAFLYSSVGHGGASGYLGLMVLFGIDVALMKPSALILNLFVSSIAFISFYRAGHFRLRLLLPFIVTSIPLAFLGATLEVSPELYKKILGVCLFIAALRIVIRTGGNGERLKLSIPIALAAGALIGFFSGMIGIGGGIILSPLLLLTRWGGMKETAAAAAGFIFLNSLAGLSGHIVAGMEVSPKIILWIVAVVAGGLLGSWTGGFRLSATQLKYLITAVLLIASIKLFVV